MGAKKILIVDDSATIREQVRLALTGGGYELLEAENGDAALSVLDDNPDTSLVISDVNMPWKDGLEMLEEMRGRPTLKDVAVILLTTESDPDQIQKAKTLGIRGWLLKPFRPDQLKKVAAHVCK